MPPKKQKLLPVVKETPIVFFLRIPEEPIEEVVPVGNEILYSDILQSVDYANQRTEVEVLKPCIENIQRDKLYHEQTACFWCCHTFDSHSFVLPISYDAYKNIYTCEGHFCSPNCALSYLYVEPCSETTKWTRQTLLNFLYVKFCPDGISPAPPRCSLRLFGGPLNIRQFRNYISEKEYGIVLAGLPPIRMLFPSMNVQGPLRDIKKYVSLSNDVVEKASESLRLKRSKPVHINIPTLDMCIQSKQ